MAFKITFSPVYISASCAPDNHSHLTDASATCVNPSIVQIPTSRSRLILGPRWYPDRDLSSLTNSIVAYHAVIIATVNIHPTHKLPLSASVADVSPEQTTSTSLEAKITQLRATLGVLEAGLTFLPLVQLAVGGLEECLAQVQIREQTRHQYEEVVSHLTSLADTIEKHLVQPDIRFIPHSIANFVQDIKGQTDLLKRLQGRPPASHTNSAAEVKSTLECYRKIGALSQQLQDDIVLSVWDQTQAQTMDARIKDLLPAYEAYYDAALSAMATKRGECMRNTRVALLDGASTWIRTNNGVKIYWLSGVAGTGKTTIAYTLCKVLQGAKRLGASFFCSRSSPDCRDVNRIVPTIAYQLGRYSNPYRQALCNVLDEDPDVAGRDISAQFEIMVAKPLGLIGKAMPSNVVVVIDALDECTDVGGTKDVLDILLRHAGSLPIKFFVSGRPDPVISESMTSSYGAMRSILRLRDIEISFVQMDIVAYLHYAPRSSGVSDEPCGGVSVCVLRIFRTISTESPMYLD